MNLWDKPYRPAENRRLDPALYLDPHQVCFITICAYLETVPFIEASLNQMIIDALHEEQVRQNCTVFTYCLMPDHLHFLIGPIGTTSVVVFVDQYKGKCTNRSWKLKWRGKLWQPRYYDHFVRTEESLAAIAGYILNNPVRKGLVERAEDWPWSGEFNPLPLGG